MKTFCSRKRGIYGLRIMSNTCRPRNERKKQQRISTMTLCASERKIVAGIMIIATDYDMEEEKRELTGSNLLGRGAEAVDRSGGRRQDPHLGELVTGSSTSSRRPPATIPTLRQPPSDRAPPAGRRRAIPPSRDALVVPFGHQGHAWIPTAYLSCTLWSYCPR
jgi:hypothetical protein